jgi:hypothetical protein
MIKRKTGYYWIKPIRCKSWQIAKWLESYQWWDTTYTIGFDIRGGIEKVDERMIERLPEKPIKIIRKRKNKITKRTRKIPC